MIREALRALLLADAAVSSAVGGSRIFPLAMPQGERRRSLVYQRAGRITDTTLEGPSGPQQTRIQLDAWAQRTDEAAMLADLAEARLDGFAGAVTWGDDSPPARCEVLGIFLLSEREDYDASAKLYRMGRDYRVVWRPGL